MLITVYNGLWMYVHMIIENHLLMIPVVLDDVDASTPGLTAVADDGVLLLEAVDAEVEVLASPAVLEDVAFALGNNSNEPSSPVKLGAGLASLAPIRVSTIAAGLLARSSRPP